MPPLLFTSWMRVVIAGTEVCPMVLVLGLASRLLNPPEIVGHRMTARIRVAENRAFAQLLRIGCWQTIDERDPSRNLEVASGPARSEPTLRPARARVRGRSLLRRRRTPPRRVVRPPPGMDHRNFTHRWMVRSVASTSPAKCSVRSCGPCASCGRQTRVRPGFQPARRSYETSRRSRPPPLSRDPENTP